MSKAENETISAAPPVLWWLRAEGFAVAAATGYLYFSGNFNGWLFAALWLIPDLSMLGYLGGSRWGARCYNLFHSYATVGVLALAGLALRSQPLLPFVLIWCNHIGVDRFLGYGLKYPSAFGDTHLGRLGKPKPAENPPSAPAPPA